MDNTSAEILQSFQKKEKENFNSSPDTKEPENVAEISNTNVENGIFNIENKKTDIPSVENNVPQDGSPIFELLQKVHENEIVDLSEQLKDKKDITINEAVLALHNANSKKQQESFENQIEKYPDELKEIIVYVANGGDIKSYITNLSSEIPTSDGNIDIEKIDLEKESNQELLVKTILTQRYKDDAYFDKSTISALISAKKDDNTLAEYTKKLKQEYINEQNKINANRTLELKQQRLEQKNQQIRNKLELAEMVKENNVIGDIPLSMQDKNGITNYISNQIPDKTGNSATQFERDLVAFLSTKKGVLQMALLIKNYDKNKNEFRLKFNTEQNNNTNIARTFRDIHKETSSVIPNSTNSDEITRKVDADAILKSFEQVFEKK